VIVLLRKSSWGLWASDVGLGGGGGGGRFPVGGGPLLIFRPAWDWFNAAIRADNEVNCGSSASVMVRNERTRRFMGSSNRYSRLLVKN
jgi:hypothetical protein